MGADFILDSKGHCFLCLKDIPKVEQEGPEKPLIHSLQQLSSYLRMDLVKVFTDSESIPLYLLAKLKNSKLKAPLCERCAGLNDKFSEVFQQLDKIQLEVVSCINLINEQLEKSVMTGETKQFRKLVDRHSMDAVVAGKLKIVQLLRLEVMKKSARCLYNAQPRVEKLEGESDEEPFDPEDFTSDETTFDVDGELSDNLEDSCLDDVPKEDDSKMEEEENDEQLGSESEPLPSTSSNLNIQPLSIFNPITGKHKCRLCKREFRYRSSCKLHHQSVHMKIRFRCDTCNKTFSQTSHLRYHQRTSCGLVRQRNPVLKCHRCGKGYTTEKTLQQHLRIVHKELENGTPVETENESFNNVDEALDMEMDDDEEAIIDVQSEDGTPSKSDPLSIYSENDVPSSSSSTLSPNSISEASAKNGGTDVSLETTSQRLTTISVFDSIHKIRYSYDLRTGKYICELCQMEINTMVGIRYHCQRQECPPQSLTSTMPFVPSQSLRPEKTNKCTV